jgi:hypothetical protein
LSNERLSIGRDCALLQRPGLDALVPASSLELIAEASLQCERGSACVVPPGQTRILRHSLDVQTLEVKGTLRWDTSKDNLELRTNYLLVTGQGARFEIGSEESPMELRATVFIKGSRMEDPDCGRRFVCGKDGAHISMHGRPLRKTWTLLAADAPAGERPGVNGISARSGGLGRALGEYREKGWTVIDPEHGPGGRSYVQRLRTRRGFRFSDVWTSYVPVGIGRVAPRFDDLGFLQWRREIVRAGVVKTPPPEVLEGAVELVQREISRLEARAHLPHIQERIAGLLSKVEGMRQGNVASAAAPTKRRRSTK